MIVLFLLALQFALIVLKVAGISILGWFGTFMPTIAYVAFVVAIYGFVLCVAALIGIAGFFSTFRRLRKR